MNKERLTNLSTYLRKLSPDKWDFDTILNSCGTVGCAIGHLPNVDPENAHYYISQEGNYRVIVLNKMINCCSREVIAEYFDISDHEIIDNIFFRPSFYETHIITPVMVADKIDELVNS